MLQIPGDLRAAIVAHAQASVPDEACGIGAIADGRLRWFEPAANVAPSPPTFFVIESRDLLRLTMRVDDEGAQLCIVHSHVKSPAEPSLADQNFARNWPGAVWLIVGQASSQPVLRAWNMDGPQPVEITLA